MVPTQRLERGAATRCARYHAYSAMPFIPVTAPVDGLSRSQAHYRAGGRRGRGCRRRPRRPFCKSTEKSHVAGCELAYALAQSAQASPHSLQLPTG